MDSGASSHMMNDENMFFEFQELTDSFINLADDKPAKIIGKGSVRIPRGGGHHFRFFFPFRHALKRGIIQ